MFSLFKNKHIRENAPLKFPEHIAVIMDGNGRWAKGRGLPRFFGHREGVKTVKKVVKRCDLEKVKHLTLYTFSTENWKRPQEEVSFLMGLLIDVLKGEFQELYDNNVQLNAIGDIDGLPKDVKSVLLSSIEKSSSNTGLKLTLALNYGSRDEILKAVKMCVQQVAEGKMSYEDIDEACFSSKLYTKNCPDPDLIIRTAGEYRLSNFLLWQGAYSELYVTSKLWPDFDEIELEKAVRCYSKRIRKFGGIT